VTFKDVRPQGRDIIQLEWPSGGPFGLLLLRCGEIQEAHFAAVSRFVGKGWPMDTVSCFPEFQREVEVQQVFRMLLQPDTLDPKQRLFQNVDTARNCLGLNEVGWVLQRHEEEMGKVLHERGLLQAAEETEGEGDAD
jgi:hypothetical protein